MFLCKVCLNSDFLCNACEKKVKELGLTEDAVKLERFLYKFWQNNRIKMPQFDNVFDIGDEIVIITKKPSLLIGTKGSFVKKIEKFFNKHIIIIEPEKNAEAIEKILNVPILGINILYRNGKEIMKVRVKEKYKERVNKNKMRKIFENIIKKEYIVSFE